MSIRAIASVGVALCVAVTTLSIYLGIVEHVYVPRATQAVFGAQIERPLMCGIEKGFAPDVAAMGIQSLRWTTGCPSLALAVK